MPGTKLVTEKEWLEVWPQQTESESKQTILHCLQLQPWFDEFNLYTEGFWKPVTLKIGKTGISALKSRAERCVLSVLSFVIMLLNKRSIITPGWVPEDYPKFLKWDAKVVQTGAQTKSKKRGGENERKKAWSFDVQPHSKINGFCKWMAWLDYHWTCKIRGRSQILHYTPILI